jgi:Fic family protein
MPNYIHQLAGWPNFTWNDKLILPLLTETRYRQGRLLGRMEALGFGFQEEANLSTLALDVVKSSEIEGEVLNAEEVRSSIARRLGMKIENKIMPGRDVEGVVDMVMDAVMHFREPLTVEKLFGWHSALFPTGRSGMYKIVTGKWRENDPTDPMQVVSGPMGKEKVHFEAPPSSLVPDMMDQFLNWLNQASAIDPVLKSAIAHLWFVTIHPFDDGNGRIGRAIMDRQLAVAEGSTKRFYSMSSQILHERKDYYEKLEEAQKGTLDISAYLIWFLSCLDRTILNTDEVLSKILNKSRFWNRNTSLSLNPRQIKVINRLLDGFDGKLTSAKWARICKCSQDTALRDIAALIELGILQKTDEGGRSSGYHLIL